jgi:hypothetical protein
VPGQRHKAPDVESLEAGLVILAVWTAGLIGNNLPWMSFTSAALGLGYIWRFRDPAVRAAHVAEWTGKA